MLNICNGNKTRLTLPLILTVFNEEERHLIEEGCLFEERRSFQILCSREVLNGRGGG